MELNENSMIKQLVESKKSLKALRTIVYRRDSTVREVFNSVGYFYDLKQKAWYVRTMQRVMKYHSSKL